MRKAALPLLGSCHRFGRRLRWVVTSDRSGHQNSRAFDHFHRGFHVAPGLVKSERRRIRAYRLFLFRTLDPDFRAEGPAVVRLQVYRISKVEVLVGVWFEFRN
jgi:hypothetical protein